MCVLHPPAKHAPTLTRRAFLQVAVAGSALIASGCTTVSTEKIEPTRFPDLDRPHDLGGTLKDLSATTLTLQSPHRISVWPLAAGLAVYGPTRESIDRAELKPGLEIGVWLDEQKRQIASLQILPPFAGLHDFPDSIQQPTPTGEMRDFGTLTLITRAGWGAALPNLQAQAEHGLFDPATNPEGWL